MSEPSLDEIVALETEVWEGLVAGTVETEQRLLSEDFLGVYPTGFAGRPEVVAYITEHGPTVVAYSLHETRLLVLSDDDVMLSYRADFTRPGGDPESRRESMYVSSLWCRRAGEWVNVFSQDTPRTGEPVP